MGLTTLRDCVLAAVTCLAIVSPASASRPQRTRSYVVRQAISTTEPVTAATSESAASPSITAVSECHMHGATVYCVAGTAEYQVVVTGTSSPAPEYTGCHHHGADTYCIGPDGEDVEVLVDGVDGSAGTTSAAGSAPSPTPSTTPDGRHCHFHAGVEHCVGGSEEEDSKPTCTRTDRDYNIPLRIGLLFAILVTSFIGVAAPIVLDPVLPARFNIVFTILKQFGTGVIISTAFVHLFTHATLMFTNKCLEIEYEGTTAAIVMAGIFISFAVDYVTHRLADAMLARRSGSTYNGDFVTVMVLEAGIIFHSLLIGLTLVVAGDSFLITLFIVILFHQMFEGIALGSRIASIGNGPATSKRGREESGADTPPDSKTADIQSSTRAADVPQILNPVKSVTMRGKMMMALAFALVTPVGMAIGIGVLHRFNGNNPSTLVALGTLDAFSAGILVWVGIVEMWARDWMYDGELVDSGAAVTSLAGSGLIAGMALMSFLGKWA